MRARRRTPPPPGTHAGAFRIAVGVLAAISARFALRVGPIYVEVVPVSDASECLTGTSGPDWLKGDRCQEL